jgi:hypothetical protein
MRNYQIYTSLCVFLNQAYLLAAMVADMASIVIGNGQ